ncbi:MAG TPA: thioredoxin domain-containing protein [Candidatus Acidoferrum sp.]|nr:thioredoxin domain-containing protein [Candidatus Acidoferrum sp.]
MRSSRPSIFAISFLALCALPRAVSRPDAQADKNQTAKPPAPKESLSKQATAARQPSPEDELQAAISNAGNDRVALVRNLEDFLKKYPDPQNKVQIYRAIVEASVQLRDDAHAAAYAERIVALKPEDIAMTVLAIQLLERTGSEAELRRAANYATRVLDYVDRSSVEEKSPRVSREVWTADKKRDRASVLSLRGRLELKLKDMAAAQKDFEESYSVLPSAAAAEQLGEIAELKKDFASAIEQYSRAFALSDANAGPAGRHEVRQKLGNVWRLAHGSDLGLGEYLLLTYDEVSQAAGSAKARKNTDAHELSQFILRKAPERIPYLLKELKGRILVVDFWATWCGPCRALEPQFSRVAAEFQGNPDVFFLAANCDEDETLVAPYLAENKVRTAVVFADGLDGYFSVNSFPTVIVMGRDGKTAYRSEGFAVESFEQDLSSAIHRVLAGISVSGVSPKPTP